jgi:hypothetical protein
MTDRPSYKLRQAREPIGITPEWELPPWDDTAPAKIDRFRPESSDHHPATDFKLLYTNEALHGIFRVEDRYVLSMQTTYGAPVHTDSCVEFFVQPREDAGYFNFEFNAGGTLNVSYVTDPTRLPGGALKRAEPLPWAVAEQVAIAQSLPKTITPEIAEPTIWTLAFSIPFAVFEPYLAAVTPKRGDRWRANFYKCGDETSHPHWAAWSEVDQKNFHLPKLFGELLFG